MGCLLSRRTQQLGDNVEAFDQGESALVAVQQLQAQEGGHTDIPGLGRAIKRPDPVTLQFDESPESSFRLSSP